MSDAQTVEEFRVVRSDGVEVPFRTRERVAAEGLRQERELKGAYQPYRLQRRVITTGEWEDAQDA